MSRQDFRSIQRFKQDIFFATKIESFWWRIFLYELRKCGIEIISYSDYGTDNSGQYVKIANANADYKLTYKHQGKIYTGLFEVKWSPKRGKCTFKVSNLRHYLLSQSNILLFCNLSDVDLRKPLNYDLRQHMLNIVANIGDIKYGIISPPNIEKMLQLPHQRKYYMGNKLCVEIKESAYCHYFQLRPLTQSHT